MIIKRLEKQCLSDEVYNQMSENILNGVWKEGDKLPSESELCKLFNVSRVSLRSALQKLKGQHLIITKQGMGSFVLSPLSARLVDNAIPVMDVSEEEYLEILEFRQAIEFKAIDLAIKRSTDEDIKNISEALNQMIENRDNFSEYTKADFNFHLSIVKASKNKLFYNVMVNYKDILYHYLEEMNKRPNDDKTYSINNHKAILESIKNKKPHKAKQIMINSMDYNFSRFNSIFKRKDDV